MTQTEYREDVLAADILFVLNHHARHITPSQRIALSDALATLVGSLGGDPTQRIGSLSIVAPVASQRGRAAYKPRHTQQHIEQPMFNVPQNAPEHLALIAN